MLPLSMLFVHGDENSLDEGIILEYLSRGQITAKCCHCTIEGMICNKDPAFYFANSIGVIFGTGMGDVMGEHFGTVF